MLIDNLVLELLKRELGILFVCDRIYFDYLLNLSIVLFGLVKNLL